MKKGKIKINTDFGDIKISCGKNELYISPENIVECLKSNEQLLAKLLDVYAENRLHEENLEQIKIMEILLRKTK
jgi:hypothetical protein